MMKAGTIRKIFVHLLGWVLFLQLVNLSVDITDVHHKTAPGISSQNVHANEIETLYEFFAGKILAGTLPDTSDEGSDKDFQTFDVVCQRLPDTDFLIPPSASNHATFKQNNFTSYFPCLPCPPPDNV